MEKYSPPGADKFKAPNPEDKPIFEDDDLDMDKLFGDAKTGEMIQSEDIINPDDPENKDKK